MSLQNNTTNLLHKNTADTIRSMERRQDCDKE